MGVHGNEKTDRVTKEAAARAAPSTPNPFHNLYSSTRVAVLASWQGRWEDVVATTKKGEVIYTLKTARRESLKSY